MSYSSFSAQGSMTFDENRNRLYRHAIEKVITPESVVLDLGAGTGILGLLAARAGARKVFLVEPEPIIQVAQAIAKENNLESKIDILQGKIEEVTLPEKVDVIISVFTGNLLFSEDLLPSLYHARDKYLKVGGAMIPHRGRLLTAPVSAPVFYRENIEIWSKPVEDIDFSCGRRFAANEIGKVSRTGDITLLGSPIVLADLDLEKTSQADCNGTGSTTVDADNLCHGILCWIEIDLGEDTLSTSPLAPAVHWSPLLLPLDPPMPVEAGTEVGVSLSRPPFGEWSWTVSSGLVTRRHSTFLSRLNGLSTLNKTLPDTVPKLGSEGQKMHKILALMGRGKAVGEIAAELYRDNPSLFDSSAEALRYVQRAALKYSA